MFVTQKWRQHIEDWQHSSLSQTTYCLQQEFNIGTFTARQSEYRKQPAAGCVALVLVHRVPTERAERAKPIAVAPAMDGRMVFTHRQGHRLELASSVPAAWVAELLRCLV